MYSIKKVFRKKSNIFLIIIFTLTIICLLLLFKYIFVTQKKVECKIYDKHINRELIVYKEVSEVLNNKSNANIINIYSDYQELHIDSENLGTININPRNITDMPQNLLGSYPKKNNEIILPHYIYLKTDKIDLIFYLNKEIDVILNNNTNITLRVSGIYDDINDFNAYYNLDYIEELLSMTKNNHTGNTRILVDHYKNNNNVINALDYEAELYDSSGLNEIAVYTSLFNLVLILSLIIILFITIIIFVVSNILFCDTKKERLIQYALGYNNINIALYYIKYYSNILLVSFSISFIFYLFMCIFNFKYNLFNNTIFNELFVLNVNHCFIIPVLLVLCLILILLYVFIRLRLFINFKYN